MPTYEEVLRSLCEADDNVVVMTAENRAAIRNLPAVLGPRFIDVGICEQTMVAAAAGLALRGRIPVCHALATFLTLRAFEFIRTDVGIGKLPVKLVGGVPGFLSDGNGPTHQAIEDVSLMRGIPNMQVVCPADDVELAECLPAVVKSGHPCYVRYCAHKPARASAQPFELGRAETIGDGTDVAILTYGFLLREALAAKELLEARGVGARVVNLRTLAPIDAAAVRGAAAARLVVTFEDHFKTGGLYSIVSEIFVAERLSPRVLPVALDARWFAPGLLEDVLRAEGFKGDQLAARILATLAEP